MNVVYSLRALRELEEIAVYYRSHASPAIATAIGDRIERAMDRLGHHPEQAPRVAERASVRVLLVLRSPYKIFYRVRSDVVEVLHIRHAARQPWNDTEWS